MVFAHSVSQITNSVDIILFIDYKLVIAVTVILKYAISLYKNLLNELESYQWC